MVSSIFVRLCISVFVFVQALFIQCKTQLPHLLSILTASGWGAGAQDFLWYFHSFVFVFAFVFVCVFVLYITALLIQCKTSIVCICICICMCICTLYNSLIHRM